MAGDARSPITRRALVHAGVAGAASLVGVPRLVAALGVRNARPQQPSGRPIPTPAQLRWQRDELALFAHFGVNTYTDREWGDGTEDPRIFVPARFDARQWARVARDAGFRSIVLTAKHHDGFCLWPSAQTTHSVASSPWREGKGDIVREVADACRDEGLGLGLYLSPWDRHEPRYGSGTPYMDFYCAQLEELLTRYGPVVEVWFDGANGEGPNGKRQVYDWGRMHALVRRLQPEAVMFSDAGPDVRWIGNERGVAGETCWSTIDPASVPYAGYDAPNVGALLQEGDPHGSVWRPGETDVSIRPGWFWHPAEDDKVRTADGVMSLYYSSVGRNSKLLLNAPPTRDGLLHDADVRSLRAFGARRRALLATDHARDATVRAEGEDPRAIISHKETRWWSAPRAVRQATLEVTLPRLVRCNVLRLQEPIALGQVVERWAVEAEVGGAWRPVASGTTIGHMRLAQFAALDTRRFRLTLSSTLGTLRLAAFGVHFDDG